MLSVVLGLIAAAVYGASDFLGGIASQRVSAIRVTAVAALVGLSLLAVGLAFVPSRWSASAVGWGVVGGLAGAAALSLLYACLALGPMSVLTPIMALTSAVVPIVVAFIAGERLNGIGVAGLVAGLIAVLLICLAPHPQAARATGRAIAMAVGAGVFVGLYLVFINRTPTDSGLAPLIVTFGVTAVTMSSGLGIRALMHRGLRHGVAPVVELTDVARSALDSPAAAPVLAAVASPPLAASAGDLGLRPATRSRARTTALIIIGCGATDAVGAVLFLLALRTGDLAIVAVLNALSPAGTILLAAIVLHERIAFTQLVGLLLAAVAAVCLALA